MVKTIRIEKDNKGPFNSGIPYEGIMCTIHRNHNNMNTPQEENIPFTSGEDVCGYLSIDSMLTYMEDFQLSFLIDLGFRIYEMECSQVIECKHQYVFNMSNIVSKKDITSSFLNS